MRSRILLALPFAMFLIFPLAAHAAIPFFGPIIPADTQQCAAGWGLVMTVINNVISFLITIAIVFVAPLMIAYAGFLFVVSPVNAGGIGRAKSILTHTIVGIVIALSGWLIVDAVMAVLYNPGNALGTWSSLVTSSGNRCLPIKTSLSQVSPTGTTTPPVIVGPEIPTGEQAIRDLLQNRGITVNKPPCTASQMAGPACGTNPGPSCTNVAGMQPATVQQIMNIANACGGVLNRCGVLVTGGTEPGHACGPKSHQAGYKVDLWQTSQLNAYLETFAITGRRGGHYSGPIRKDSCNNEYVKESSPTIWDITITAACGTTTTPPPGGGTGRTNWPPSTVALDWIRLNWSPHRVNNVANGAENIFSFEVPAGISDYEFTTGEMPGTPTGYMHITLYDPSGNILQDQPQLSMIFAKIHIFNPAPGLHHAVIIQTWDPNDPPTNPSVGAFLIQIRHP